MERTPARSRAASPRSSRPTTWPGGTGPAQPGSATHRDRAEGWRVRTAAWPVRCPRPAHRSVQGFVEHRQAEQVALGVRRAADHEDRERDGVLRRDRLGFPDAGAVSRAVDCQRGCSWQQLVTCLRLGIDPLRRRGHRVDGEPLMGFVLRQLDPRILGRGSAARSGDRLSPIRAADPFDHARSVRSAAASFWHLATSQFQGIGRGIQASCSSGEPCVAGSRVQDLPGRW